MNVYKIGDSPFDSIMIGGKRRECVSATICIEGVHKEIISITRRINGKLRKSL